MSRPILPNASSPEPASPDSPAFAEQAASLTSTSTSTHKPTYAKRGKITIVACVPCRKRKTKCDGRRPVCGQCTSREGECHFDMTSDQRRLTYLRDHSEQLQEKQNALESLLRTMQSSSEDEANDILRRLRSGQDIFLIAEQVQAGQVLFDVARPKFSETVTVPYHSDPHSSRDASHNNDVLHTLLRVLKTADFNVATEIVQRIRVEENVTSILRAANSGTLVGEPLHLMMQGTPQSIEAQFAQEEHTFGLVKGAAAESAMGNERSNVASPQERSASASRVWTSVTNDWDLLEHLITLYFTWQHSFFQNFPENLFRDDYASGRSRYCSKSLVNAICAAACFLSNRQQVRVDRTDGQDIVSSFVNEAKRSLEEFPTPTIPSTSATYLISYVEGTRGKPNELWMLGGKSVLMALELDLHLQYKGGYDPRSPDQDGAVENERLVRTHAFWGCFHVCQLNSFTLGRMSLLSTNSITVELPHIDPVEDDEPWEAYEMSLPNRPGAKTSTFHYSASLSTIVNSTLTMFFAPSVPLTGALLLEEHQKYIRWHRNLPPKVASTSKAPPHVLCLNMYYHAAILQLFRPFLKAKIDNSNIVPREVCRQAANAISELWLEHRSLYGLAGIYMFQIQCLLSASTVHIVDVPAIAATKYLTQACDSFQELRSWNGWATSSLSVLRHLAEKWKMVLPREAEEALYRHDRESEMVITPDFQMQRSSWAVGTQGAEQQLVAHSDYSAQGGMTYQHEWPRPPQNQTSGTDHPSDQGSKSQVSPTASSQQFDVPQFDPQATKDSPQPPSKRLSGPWPPSASQSLNQQKRQRLQAPKEAHGRPERIGSTDLAPMYQQPLHKSSWQQQQPSGPVSSYLYTPMSAQQAPLLAPVHSNDITGSAQNLSDDRGGDGSVQQPGPWDPAAGLQESVEGLTFGDDWRDPFMAFLPSDQHQR